LTTVELAFFSQRCVTSQCRLFRYTPKQGTGQFAVFTDERCIPIGSLADLAARARHVRFTLDSGHSSGEGGKSAKSRHAPGTQRGWRAGREALAVSAVPSTEGWQDLQCGLSFINAAASSRTSGFMKNVLSRGIMFTSTPSASSSAATIGPTAATAIRSKP
jgi:hypothetical protein